jgi:inorganic pyrophosphatase
MVNQYTLSGEKHFLRDYPPVDSSGNINVVVEIPAGTNAKWEVDKTTGQLKWEFKQGKPRVVSYLGYPGNYGMIPGTCLLKEMGGDGDPLDVIVIGPAVPRGSVVKARPIGVLKMLDDGEQDDKIIALLLDSPLDRISTIEELEREYKGITDIIEIWFSNYKGPGEMLSKGFGSVSEARDIIEAAAKAYREEFLTTHQEKE